MSDENSLERAEALLTRLESTRAELDRLAGGDDPDLAIDVLTELAQIAREVEVELTRVRQEADEVG